jgi:hypothetical protein
MPSQLREALIDTMVFSALPCDPRLPSISVDNRIFSRASQQSSKNSNSVLFQLSAANTPPNFSQPALFVYKISFQKVLSRVVCKKP